MLDYRYFNSVGSVGRLPEYADSYSLSWSLCLWRKHFLKRKNINDYKPLKRGTPESINKIVNCLDRKINGSNILCEESFKKYLSGIKYIYSVYYKLKTENRSSRYDAYIQYRANYYITIGNLIGPMTFKEFKKSGLVNKYRSIN